MAICLNTKSTYNLFQMLVNDTFFVDKSAIIEKLSARINTPNRYICITNRAVLARPRCSTCWAHTIAKPMIQRFYLMD